MTQKLEEKQEMIEQQEVSELPERIIGRYTGAAPGPLLICLGGLHGNEPAGIQALELIFRMLEIEPEANPGFTFRGRMIGIRGNLQAIARKERYLKRDLNRMWTEPDIERVRSGPAASQEAEDRELRELIDLIEAEVEAYQPDRFILLDLHTTTARGGIFSIVTNDPESTRVAVELHAPVIKGMLKGIKGTCLHYFNNLHFKPETTVLAFESGQHEDPLSVNRAIAAVTNCLRTIGCVREEDVENRHDELLIEYSKNLPKVAELITSHPIEPADRFRMVPDYENFQQVEKGEVLAYDKNGPIRAQDDGCILMPLYQQRGEDGFFLIRPLAY